MTKQKSQRVLTSVVGDDTTTYFDSITTVEGTFTDTFEENVGIIGVEEVEEHEDGSATYSFHYDESTRDKLAAFGIELIIVCAAYGWDIQDALDSLKR
jgi:hypothetical protein